MWQRLVKNYGRYRWTTDPICNDVSGDRQTVWDRQTDRQTDTETQRQTPWTIL